MSNENKKGKKGAAASTAAADPFPADTITAEAKTIIAKARETEFLVCGVPNLDGTYGTPIEVPVAVMETLANQIAAEAPTTSFMLIAVGPADVPKKQCSILVHSASSALPASDWMIACAVSDSLYGDAKRAFGYFEHEFPIKGKDEVSGKAFAFLRKHKLLKEDDSDDEHVAFDINAE